MPPAGSSSLPSTSPLDFESVSHSSNVSRRDRPDLMQPITNAPVLDKLHSIEKWTGWDLNPRPLPCQDSDLPADLPARNALYWRSAIKVSLRVAVQRFSAWGDRSSRVVRRCEPSAGTLIGLLQGLNSEYLMPRSLGHRTTLERMPSQRNHLQVSRDSMITAKKRVEVSPAATGPSAEILTAEALEFLADLHRRFNPTRLDLVRRRAERQARVDRGRALDFSKETRRIREDSWSIAPVPVDLMDRRVEITGPTDRKMMINALNSGAKMFMA